MRRDIDGVSKPTATVRIPLPMAEPSPYAPAPVIGAVSAGIGGWLFRLGCLLLLVGVVTGVASANTAREREAVRASEIRVRCHNSGRLNPEFVRFCMDCRQPV